MEYFIEPWVWWVVGALVICWLIGEAGDLP